MFLESLNLQNFRNYKKKSFDFSDKTTLIVGPNASGKTNILEAIYLLSRGKSFRAEMIEQMIQYGQEIARVEGVILESLRSPRDNLGAPRDSQLEVVLTSSQVSGRRTAKKLFKVNGVGKRWRDFVGKLKCVLFRPEDIEIVLGSPSIRRDYLDLVLEPLDGEYQRCNLAYKKGLKQRNRLLDKIREGEARRTQLEFWNRLLIKNGEIISRKREELVDFYNNQFSIFNFQMNIGIKSLTIEYDKSIISLPRLEKYAKAEVAIGATLVGPHRDNLKFKMQNSKLKNKEEHDLELFGSRGEQRMAVLALKLAELEFVSQKALKITEGTESSRPLLLLDDIFSELDSQNRQTVSSTIPHQQTIITANDPHLVEKKFLDKMEIVNL